MAFSFGNGRQGMAFLLAAALVTVLAFSGCKKPEPVVLHCYCDETFWSLMRDETTAFHNVYGIQVVLLPLLPPKADQTKAGNEAAPSGRTSAPWRSRPKIRGTLDPAEVTLDPGLSHLISSLSQDGRADLFMTDSILQVERLEDSSLVTHRYPVCYLTMSLLVSKGNPFGIRSIRDVFDKKVKVGIMAPSKDGMGLTALSLLAQDSGNASEETVETLVRQFDRHDELMEALENAEVSAILAWNSVQPDNYLLRKYAVEYGEKFKDRIEAAKRRNTVDEINEVLGDMFDTILAEKRFTDRVELLEPSRAVETSLISLSCSHHDRHCRRFADFLISPLGREIMRKHGFVSK